jgi:hypothetical protein
LGSFSPSSALQQTYEDLQGRLNAQINDLRLPAECAGSVFVIAGRIAGMDLFDKPATLAKLWPKLARAYALDALEEKDAPSQSVTREAVRNWLESLADVPSHVTKSPGLGHDVRLRNDRIVGSCLVVEQCPVHAELFALEAHAA